MSRLRWGLLSTARINRLIIPAIRASARSDLTTVASRTLDRAQAYAAEWKIPRALGSYEALLDDPDIDVIYISLPNSLHVEWTVRALEAGKHVLCEKPLALTVEDVDRIQARGDARVARRGRSVHVPPPSADARRRSDREERAARRRPRIQGGVHVSADARGRRAARPGARRRLVVGRRLLSRQLFVLPRWRRRRSRSSGGSSASPTGIDLEFAGMMRFADGSVAQFDSGFVGPFRAEMEVIGTRRRRCGSSVRSGPTTLSRLLLTTGDDTETLPFDPAAAVRRGDRRHGNRGARRPSAADPADASHAARCRRSSPSTIRPAADDRSALGRSCAGSALAKRCCARRSRVAEVLVEFDGAC